MADEHVAAVLEKFRLESEELTELRRRIDARIARLQTAIIALTAAESGEPLRFEGSLADACRAVLKSAQQPMAPTEVRNGVVGIGFQLSSLAHDNPMASIHSVLKRFVDAGDAEKVASKDGTKYRWTGRAQAERTYAGRLSVLFEAENIQTIGSALANLTSSTESLAGFQEELAKATRWIEAPSLNDENALRDAQRQLADVTKRLPNIEEALGMKPKKK